MAVGSSIYQLAQLATDPQRTKEWEDIKKDKSIKRTFYSKQSMLKDILKEVKRKEKEAEKYYKKRSRNPLKRLAKVLSMFDPTGLVQGALSADAIRDQRKAMQKLRLEDKLKDHLNIKGGFLESRLAQQQSDVDEEIKKLGDKNLLAETFGKGALEDVLLKLALGGRKTFKDIPTSITGATDKLKQAWAKEGVGAGARRNFLKDLKKSFIGEPFKDYFGKFTKEEVGEEVKEEVGEKVKKDIRNVHPFDAELQYVGYQGVEGGQGGDVMFDNYDTREMIVYPWSGELDPKTGKPTPGSITNWDTRNIDGVTEIYDTLNDIDYDVSVPSTDMDYDVSVPSTKSVQANLDAIKERQTGSWKQFGQNMQKRFDTLAEGGDRSQLLKDNLLFFQRAGLLGTEDTGKPWEGDMPSYFKDLFRQYGIGGY